MPKQVLVADFAGVSVTSTLSALWVTAAFGVHDTAVMQYVPARRPAGAPSELVPAVGTPVRLSFGRGPGDVATWLGYVHHHARLPGLAGGRPRLEVVAMGTSYVLSAQRARAFTDTSVTTLATRLASEAGLRAVVSTAPRKRSMIVQSGRSDFAMLNDAARAEGLRLWVGNGLLQLLEPATLFHRAGAVAAQVFGAPGGVLRKVTAFSVVAGPALAMTDGSAASRSTYGFTGLPGRTTYRSGTGATPLGAVDTSRDLANLGSVVTATYADASPYTVEVAARLSDGQHLRPGSLIEIADDQVLPEHQGRWLVIGVEHEMDYAGVYTNARLVRTANGRGKPANLSRASERAEAYLSGAHWRAAAQGVERV